MWEALKMTNRKKSLMVADSREKYNLAPRARK